VPWVGGLEDNFSSIFMVSSQSVIS
jgi:hypothetical protein